MSTMSQVVWAWYCLCFVVFSKTKLARKHKSDVAD